MGDDEARLVELVESISSVHDKSAKPSAPSPALQEVQTAMRDDEPDLDLVLTELLNGLEAEL
jgi:hypothetical protein